MYDLKNLSHTLHMHGGLLMVSMHSPDDELMPQGCVLPTCILSRTHQDTRKAAKVEVLQC